MDGKEDLESGRVRLDLMEKIAAGTYPIGRYIPATAELVEMYGVSRSPVRDAVAALQRAGILAGVKGGGVRVERQPTDDELTQARPIGQQLAHVTDKVRRLADHVERSADPSIAELKEQVAELQGLLVDLYLKSGFENPYQQQSNPSTGRKARTA